MDPRLDLCIVNCHFLTRKVTADLFGVCVFGWTILQKVPKVVRDWFFDTNYIKVWAVCRPKHFVVIDSPLKPNKSMKSVKVWSSTCLWLYSQDEEEAKHVNFFCSIICRRCNFSPLCLMEIHHVFMVQTGPSKLVHYNIALEVRLG